MLIVNTNGYCQLLRAACLRPQIVKISLTGFIVGKKSDKSPVCLSDVLNVPYCVYLLLLWDVQSFKTFFI